MSRKLKTMDGNAAAAHVAYAFSEVAAIYPITPSSPMAENIDEWTATDKKNIFGEKVRIVEMQSEGGAAGAVHGSAIAGAYTSTFTASQGLLLMIPNMYKIAAEQEPAVFHVAARSLSSHALCIFGDQSDVMACRQTGFVLLCSNSVQEAMDLAAVAHLSAIGGKLPVLHFFDGFRTSHETQKIEVWDYEELKSMVDWDAVKRYKKSVFHPLNPYSMGSAEQPETFFQHREASNTVYTDSVDVVEKYMDLVNSKIGTNYKPFNYYGAKDATEVIIAMGSVCEAAEEVVDYLNGKGKKVGLVKVRLYRPFSSKKLLEAIPDTVKSIAVMDRTKEPGGMGEPLYLDVCASVKDSRFKDVFIAHGRYGLGSKDVQPGDILAVYENLWNTNPKEEFTISIDDDVTNLSLKPSENPDVEDKSTVACKFWGLGGDGTVGANKNSIKIIGDNTDEKVQAYFQYDSKKSSGVTISHLRFGKNPIKSTYYVKQADFIACHVSSYIKKYDIVSELKPGGHFLLNCSWTGEKLENRLPNKVKKYIALNDIQFYTCDASAIANEIGLGYLRTNTVLQSAFFKLSNIIPLDDAVKYLKEAIEKTYGKKGEKVVNMNKAAVDAGIKEVRKIEIPEAWKTLPDDEQVAPLEGKTEEYTKYLNEILSPVTLLKGDDIPVSKFVSTANGRVPAGTTKYEKRGIAVETPEWDSSKCIQCNRCVTSCPQAAIRPFILMGDETENPNGDVAPMIGAKENSYAIRTSAFDCTGCGLCVTVCPAKEKALTMKYGTDLMRKSQAEFDYAKEHYSKKELPVNENTMKGVQFKTPMLEFSGACPGCGESPYAKLITQLFGERMFIANATGCTSIWGCSAPSAPYTVNLDGRGPAWANSLFEDNAEFGLGMSLAMTSRRQELRTNIEEIVKTTEKQELKEKAAKWLDVWEDSKLCEEAGEELLAECKKSSDPLCQYVVENRNMLIKPSVWIFGGDGWAYDIGYGGLDHVLALRENVNIFVFDTEVYSNTGGQASKATPTGAVAKFSANGKVLKKKDLAQIAMTYDYVYVAKIALGANYEQALKAIKEAENYDGPSLIIAYAPCVNHGIKTGMKTTMDEMKKAVDSGYWNLFRYNPALKDEGKNPLILDSGEPTMDYEDFLMGEVRYSSLKLKSEERAKELFAIAKQDAKERYEKLTRQQKSLESD